MTALRDGLTLSTDVRVSPVSTYFQASQQVGMLEALTYCLMLNPQLLTVTPKVMQILGEVLAMTETDDLDPGRNAVPALYNSLPG